MFVMLQGVSPFPEPTEFWVGGPGFPIFLLSVAFFGISVFLLRKSVAYQSWAAIDAKSEPNSGVSIAWTTMFLIVLLWILRWILVENEAGGNRIFLSLLRGMFARPLEFAMLGFVASVPLISSALFNFFASYSMARRSGTEGTDHLLAASAAATLYTILQLGGSIASIIALALS